MKRPCPPSPCTQKLQAELAEMDRLIARIKAGDTEAPKELAKRLAARAAS